MSFQPERYYESISSDYHFSLQKVMRQRESLDLMLGNDGPSAWMLVTAYYQAFYAAIQISRLTGLYNIYLSSSHISRINDLNESSKSLTESGAYLGVGAFLEKESNSVVVKFSKKWDQTT